MTNTDRNYDLAVEIINDALEIVDANIRAEEALAAEKSPAAYRHEHNADGWRKVRREIAYAAEHHDAYDIYKRRGRFTREGLQKWAAPYQW